MTATYDAAFQNKILTLALRDEQFMRRCEGLLKPEYFDLETHSYLVDSANRHFETYRQLPSGAIVVKEVKDGKTAGLLKDDFVDDLKPVLKTVFSPGVDLSNRDYFVDEVSKFARQRAMEGALEEAIDILDKGGDFAEIEEKIKKAQAVGALEGTAGFDLFDSVAARVLTRAARLAGTVVSRGITTGHRELDDILYHKGWGKKEMYILLGGAKAGKSTGLMHFALNAVEAGYNVLYTSHENSAEVVADRMDACVAGVPMKDLDVSGATIKAAYSKLQAKGGVLRVEEFPMGAATVNDIRRVIRKYAAQGIIFDLLVCDYADELRAERRRNDERHELAEIYTSFRALCTEENLAGLTATQTNRKGHGAATAQATDAAEDFSKMRKADGVISINATEEERKLNQLRLHFALMRNNEQGVTIHCMTDRSRMKFITRVVKVV